MKKNDDNPVGRIKEQLEILKLFRAKEVIDDVLSEAARANLPASRIIEQLLSAEVAALVKRRIERRIRESKLPERKLLADYDFDFQTGVDKQQIMELATLDFAQRKQGVIFAGGSGTGKSHIAKALLLIGCQKNYRCLYTNAATMLRQLMAALADDTLDKKLKYYTKPDILLIDEVGFDRIEQQEARNAFLFFKVIDARYTQNSTWLTTNIDFKALGDYLRDPVVTASIVDRMVHHSIIINIDGPSWRLHESKKLNRPKTGKPKNPSKKKPEKDDEPKV